MLDRLKTLITQLSQDQEAPTSNVSYEKAVAALLIEVMLADESIDEREKDSVLALIKKETKLEDINELYQEMKAFVEEAHDLFQFTKAINEVADKNMKEQLMLSLWRVAFADGVLNEHEDYRIRRISELLYVPHSVFIQTKLAAQAEKSA
ncbi:TerB family tellurite resistance protein [Marinomonas agarivorans]|nr:TerB family tellurite resistance protein [Marinomonas agarivorans]